MLGANPQYQFRGEFGESRQPLILVIVNLDEMWCDVIDIWTNNK